MDLMSAISAIPGVGPFLPWIMAGVAITAAVAPFLPPPVDGGSAAYAGIYKLINAVALNWGHARNVTDPAGK